MQISVFYLCYMYLFFIPSKHFVLLLRNNDKKEDRQNELKAFTKMYLFKKKKEITWESIICPDLRRVWLVIDK